jgi:hypothetical protein
MTSGSHNRKDEVPLSGGIHGDIPPSGSASGWEDPEEQFSEVGCIVWRSEPWENYGATAVYCKSYITSHTYILVQ